MYIIIPTNGVPAGVVVANTTTYGTFTLKGFVVRQTLIQTPRVPTKDALTGQLWPVVRG